MISGKACGQEMSACRTDDYSKVNISGADKNFFTCKLLSMRMAVFDCFGCSEEDIMVLLLYFVVGIVCFFRPVTEVQFWWCIIALRLRDRSSVNSFLNGPFRVLWCSIHVMSFISQLYVASWFATHSTNILVLVCGQAVSMLQAPLVCPFPLRRALDTVIFLCVGHLAIKGSLGVPKRTLNRLQDYPMDGHWHAS